MIIPFTGHMRNCIKVFMDAFDQKCYSRVEEVPCETSLLRADLINEEAKEYNAALPKTVDELDAIIDLFYVIIGTNLALNIPVHDYRSGQLPGAPIKHPIFTEVKDMTQDLESRFPCAKIQNHTSNKLIARLLDIGIQQGYKLRPAFDAVHAANMSKLWDYEPLIPKHSVKARPGGKFLVKREDGKVIKPPTFCAPDLTSFV